MKPQENLSLALLQLPPTNMALVLLLAFSLFFHGALGGLVCEDLPIGLCSYAISSGGFRCLLETYASKDGYTNFQCKTADVLVVNMNEYIETDECIQACGLDRKTVGISSDTLLEPQYTAKICSPECSENCPNIVDLHTNLALAEGVSLPNLCMALHSSPHRAMFELLSSGAAADSSFTAPAPDSMAPGPVPNLA